MNYKLIFSEDATRDISLIKKSGDKSLYNKLMALFDELEIHPTSGTGKPEQLKYREATWSRRLSSKRRLVYKIIGDKVQILILSAYGHYTDK